jgi:hypothetical protein
MRGGPVRGRPAMVPSAARPIPTIGLILSPICARPRPIRSSALPRLSQPRSSARWRGIRRSFRTTGRLSLQTFSPQPRGRNSRTRPQTRAPPSTPPPHRVGLTLNRSSRSSRNLLLRRHRGRATRRVACFRVTHRSQRAGCLGRTPTQLRRLRVHRSVQAAVAQRPRRRACPVPRPDRGGQHRFSRRPQNCKARSRPAAPISHPHRVGLTLNRSSRSSRNLLLRRHRGRSTSRVACFPVTHRSPRAGCSGRTRTQLRRLQAHRSVQATVPRRCRCRACPAPRPRWGCQRLNRCSRRSHNGKSRSRRAAPRSIARTVCFPAQLMDPGPHRGALCCSIARSQLWILAPCCSSVSATRQPSIQSHTNWAHRTAALEIRRAVYFAAAAAFDNSAAIGRAVALARRCTIVEPKPRRLFHQDASAIAALPLHPRQDTERGQSIRSLEQFWDQYRAGGSLESERPTNADYGEAVRRALIASGLSPEQASDLVGQAAAQRAAYGLSDSAAVPHIPPPIWRRRRN